MRKMIAECICDICGGKAENINYYKKLCEYLDYHNLQRKLCFVDSTSKEINLCNKCAEIIGKYIEKVIE